MKETRKTLWTIVAVAPLLAAGLILSQGCQSDATPDTKPKAGKEKKPGGAEEKAGEKASAPDAKAPEGATTTEAKLDPSEKLAPIPIKLPKPLFSGTPKNIAPRPTLEKFQDKRGPFLAPEGTVNLALNKPVTSSDKEPIIGESKLVNDGDKEGTDGSFVEYGPGLQWIQIDLGQPSVLYAFVISHYHMEARVYHDVVIQVCDDPDFIKDVQTVFNNDFDNSSGLGIGKDKEYIEASIGKLIDAKGVKGRYVRLYSKGNTSNDQNHYIEVEVFGKPLK
jgi:hypothetical protein